MKRRLLLLILFALPFVSHAQLIVTNNQTPAQLVQNVLLGGGITVSNIKFNGSTVSANLLRDQAGRFANGVSTNIGINEGVILSTGKSTLAIGPNDIGNATENTDNRIDGDPDLAAIATGSINTIAIIEFDFVPIGEELNFNYVFASEEYPEFANSTFNDVFGFFLSGPGISGPFTNGAANIAIIPTTTSTGVTINNLNNGTNNAGPCEFCAYYVNNGDGDTPGTNSTIQYDGFTTVLTASATVQCGEMYHIKLAIANVGDPSYDSAVFLQANSFNSTPLTFPDDYLVANGFAPCADTTVELCTGLADTVLHVWTLDGAVIPGESGPCITVSEPGEYCATAYPFGPGCPVSDCIVIEFQPELPISQPDPVTMCDETETSWDLTNAEPSLFGALNPADYGEPVMYYLSYNNAFNGASPIPNPTTYVGTGLAGQIIFVRVDDNLTGCIAIKSFELQIVCIPDLYQCSNIFDFTPQIPYAVGSGNDPADYTVTFHHTQADADADVSPITPYTAYVGTDLETIYIRVELISNPASFTTSTFQLHVVPAPATPNPADVTVCDSYTLPALAAGSTYHSAAGGDPGTIITGPITTTQTVYIYAQTGTTPNCTAEGDFLVTVNITPATPDLADVTACDGYTLPALAAGQTYHSASGGDPGTEIAAGTNITSTQTIYVFAQTGTVPNCTAEGDFVVTINNTPATPNPADVTVCDSYTLPALAAGSTYHSAAGGDPGTIITGPITTTQTVYIYAQTGTTPNCTAEGDFLVTVNTTPATPNLADVTACDGYTLPALAAGQTYHSASGGDPGTEIAAGTNITSTQTIYVFAQTGTVPNCTAEGDFVVTINNTPATPNPADVTVCDSYTLPALAAGSTYHSAAGGDPGTIITGPITTTQTVYIYAQTGTTPNCTAEGDFLVTVNITPATPDLADVTACDGYTLPALAAGQTYHSASGGDPGTEIAAGTNITSTQTIYVFAQTGTVPNCTAEGDFVVTINNTPATPNPADVTVCDSYTLPALAAGSTYHSASGGDPGTIITGPITTTQTVYIYAQTGTTPNCTAEGDFLVTVNITPATPDLADVTACDGYTLPALAAGQTYHSASGGDPGTEIAAGTNITSTQTIYVFAQTGTVPNCTAEGDFVVTINNTPATPNPADVTVCDSYTLPALAAGSTYHSAAGGDPGTIITGPITTTQTVYIYAQTGTTPNCTAEGDFLVTVNDTPIADDPADVVACDSYTLPALNVGNYFEGTSGTGAPHAAGELITSDITLYVYAQTGTTPNCSTQNSFDIAIFHSPGIVPPTPLEVCDDNNDGFSCLLDLTTKINGITAGQPLTVTFHETEDDAHNNANPIISTAAYCNITPGLQTLYVRVFDPGAPQCASFTTLELHVNPVPVAAAAIADYHLCDDNNPGDQIENFNLTMWDSNVLQAGQSGITVTYHLSQGDAQGGTGALVSPYPNISTPQQIWVRLENAASSCFSVASFNLVVDPLPAITPLPDMNACSLGSANTAGFDLTTNDIIVSGGVPGRTVSYYLNSGDAHNEQNALASPYTNITNPQTLTVGVEDVATGCRSYTTLTLNVTQGPSAFTPNPLEVCDDNNDGFGSFVLQDADNQIAGGSVPAGVSITYHETQEDANNAANPILAVPYHNIDQGYQVIYVRVFYPATGCSSYTQLELFVRETPEANEVPPLTQCDTNADGIASFDLTQATAGILGDNLVPATDYTVTYYVLQANAQAGTNPITNVLGFNNSTPNSQTIWVRVESNLYIHCFDVIPLELIVYPAPITPAAGFVAPYSLCDVNNPGDQTELFDLTTKIPVDILGGQTGMEVSFYLNQVDALSQTNAIANTTAYANITNAQTLYVVIKNTTTGCTSLTTMDLRVEPLPAPIPQDPLSECDPDGDGFAVFNLDAIVSDLIQGDPNMIITFHPTQDDADNNVNTLSPGQTAAYQNIVPVVDFIYVRAEDALTHCHSVLAIELNAIASPQMPVLADLTICDEDANSQNGFTSFDLTVQDAAILAGQSGPASAYTIAYYLSEADAIAGVSPIVPPTNYINTANPQTIWAVVSDTDGTCSDIGSFRLVVNTPLALPVATQLSICDDGPTSAVPTAVFDLTLENGYYTGNTPGYTVEYYLSSADAHAGSNPIANPSAFTNTANAQTLYVVVTGPSPSACRSYSTLTIRVLPLPVPQSADIPALVACDDNNSPNGTEEFDLTANEAYISNGASYTFGYYTSEAEANAQTNPITNPAAYEVGTGIIWIRVMNNQADFYGNFCYRIVQQQITVNPLPVVAVSPVVYQMCDANNDGFESFTLLDAQYADIILGPGQSASDFTMTYYLSQADAQAGTSPLPGTYTNITNPQDIYVRIVNNATGCVNATGVVTLRVAAGATSAAPAAVFLCDTDTDGLTTGFDLTQFDTVVLDGQDPALFSVTYFPSLADATAGTNAIATPSAYDTPTADLYAVVTNNTTFCRSAPALVSITVEALAAPVITGDSTICVDYDTNALLSSATLTVTGVDAATHTFEWFVDTQAGAIPGATATSYTATAAGSYTVVATSQNGCVSAPSPAFTVTQSGPPVAVGAGYTISNAFGDNQTIIVTVVGFGHYLYALDQGPLLDNGGVFTGVNNIYTSSHTVRVVDIDNACSDITIGPIMMVDYPPYFTPNGDGVHDTWNIWTLSDQPSTKIYIFDRYGKFLKQISPQGLGWDGTYNGQPLPSTDYWFTVYYPEAGKTKEFKAHFSLKR